MNTDFEKTKKDVLTCYNDLLQIADQLENSEQLKNSFKLPKDSMESLAAQAAKIKEDKFCLMVAGEAKSGKSTFINAYLGTEILPMDVKQCTSSVVEIRYGEEFTLYASYADGRHEKFIGEQEVRDFLIKNGALDDAYRDIPVTYINMELLIKRRDKPITEKVIREFLTEVKNENIHKLPEKEYEHRIREYINKKHRHWKDIVVQMEIQCPFADESMHGIHIIDSPGVNAAGKVGDATEKYIESADAIMFLRPITGQAIEANSFKVFLEANSISRNKNAMFLVLTRAASDEEEAIDRAYDEFLKLFATNIAKEHIIPVDSKAELYFHMFKNLTTEEIDDVIKSLNAQKKAAPFLRLSWLESEKFKESFLQKLKQLSRFDSIAQSLNRFGRKAHYLAFSDFLCRILKVYSRIVADLKEKIRHYELKAVDPALLAAKIADEQIALDDIYNKMNTTVDSLTEEYNQTGGIIENAAEQVMKEYLEKIQQIHEDSRDSLEELERISFFYKDKYINFQLELQKKILDECNQRLVKLSDENAIPSVMLEPDFTPELLEKIKCHAMIEAEEEETYTRTEMGCFEKKRTRSVFKNDKYFRIIKNDIIARIEDIKNTFIEKLRYFVNKLAAAYINELKSSADNKKEELKRIKQEKKTADEIAAIIAASNGMLQDIEPRQKSVHELKGGIDAYVQ